MISSEIPLSENEARKDLANLLKDNINYNIDYREINKNNIFEGWRMLCKHYSPVFLEKSPHHLLQWSSIELIIESTKKIKDVDFFIVGLVRNPMDVLYSHYKRWGMDPDKMQYQWMTSYNNLLKLQEIKEDINITSSFNFKIIKYEDIVQSKEALKSVIEFCNIDIELINDNYLHCNSLRKWKEDGSYGFTLSKNVAELAKEFGYDKQSLINENYFLWPIKKKIVISFYSLAILVKRIIGRAL